MRNMCVGVGLALCGVAWGQGMCEPEEVQAIAPGDPLVGGDFGLAVGIWGDAIIVGARRATGVEALSGAAYVFRELEGVWGEEVKLFDDEGHMLDEFGQAVAIGPDIAAVGSPASNETGAVFVYRFNEEAWGLDEKVTPADGEPLDFFGASVALNGDQLVVGATRDSENDVSAGSVYVFEFDGRNWIQVDKLLTDDGAGDDAFGIVSVDADVIAVGAQGHAAKSGAVYVFRFDEGSGSYLLEVKLAPEELEPGDRFGVVGLVGNRLIVGAPGDDDAATNAGAAYVFQYVGGQWTQVDKLTAADPDTGDEFGSAVATRARIAVIGARSDDEGGTNAGAAYLFRLVASDWTQEAKIIASDSGVSDLFAGSLGSIALAQDEAVIGAPTNGNGQGTAYVFDLNCPCPGDFNGDGSLDIVDFVSFQLAFQALDPSADCDGNQVLNIVDFVCFQLGFQQGCDS